MVVRGRDGPQGVHDLVPLRLQDVQFARAGHQDRQGQRAGRRALRDRGWHAFRHYAGTRLVRQTGSLEHAARHLGHASLETTRVYAKWSDTALPDALASW
ncbi:site-specific integrase [Deinococcus sp. A31D244]|uniref:site-specific integrase n=1 Tax=Deinococcus sp. A31D244 TaxID=3397675 RepID=UPI0039DFDC46